MRIFSFDTAEVKMGFVCLEYSNDAARIIREARERLAIARSTGDPRMISAALVDMRRAIESCMTLRAAYNICIAQYDETGKHRTAQRGDRAVERAVQLKNKMRELRGMYGDPDAVIVEFQMSINSTTVSISHQLIYEFCDTATVCYIQPSRKLCVELDPSTSYAEIQAQYIKPYDGNKAHSKNNLRYFIQHWPISADVARQIPARSQSADVADALMQCIAWLHLLCQKGVTQDTAPE